jgi:hypothetical protein
VWPELCLNYGVHSHIIFTPCKQSDELYIQIAYEFRDGIQKDVWPKTNRIKPRRDEEE